MTRWSDRQDAYKAKLRDPRWQRKRLQILERDEWRCRLCMDSESTLHVHHRWYLPDCEPWDYPVAALLTLCESCHETETELTSSATHDLPLIAKQAGAMGSELDQLCGVLSLTTESPLDEVEWAVLLVTIASLLRSRLEKSSEWQDAKDRYHARLREAANSTEE